MQRLTFIGNGNMALSIAQGLKERFEIEVVGRNIEKLQQFESVLGTSVTKHLLDGFDVSGKKVILCIKPNNVEQVCESIQGKAEVIYSVLAGTTLQKLKNNFNAAAFVRTMPNLAASVHHSMTTLTGDINYQEEALQIFNAIGPTLWLSSEKELDIATALAGSGPAYLSLIAEALTDGAVKQGLKREDAMQIMRGLFGGFGKLIETHHPALLKDGVMSPGGTTAAGYAALEDGGVRSACIDAIEQAYKKATQLA